MSGNHLPPQGLFQRRDGAPTFFNSTPTAPMASTSQLLFNPLNGWQPTGPLTPGGRHVETSNPTQYSLVALSERHPQAGVSPLLSPVTSYYSSQSATTPGSDVSTVSSVSSYASDRRSWQTSGQPFQQPVATSSPYPGFWPAPSAAPQQQPTYFPDTPEEPIAPSPASWRASAGGLGPSTAPIRTNAGQGYFDYAAPDRLQIAAANFDRLFGRWRTCVDAGRAGDAQTNELRTLMEAAYAQMMELARERDAASPIVAVQAAAARDNRKRVNSLSSPPNPVPAKQTRRGSITKPPPLLHVQTSPVVTARPQQSPTVPQFSQSTSAHPASQATVEGLHFTYPSTILPSHVTAVDHTPHTPSPLAAGIVASAPHDTSLPTPVSPQHRGELADAFLNSAARPASMHIPRQPTNPRVFGHLASSSSPHHQPNLSWGSSHEDMDSLQTMSASEDDMAIDRRPSIRYIPTSGMDDIKPIRQRTLSKGSAMAYGSSDVVTTSTHMHISAALKSELDEIFLRFLQDLCNDPDRTNAKGEKMYQPLMKSKMEKADELGQWRPFKFRIAAFTAAFMEAVAEAGLTEKDVSNKMLRTYLWQQNLICRFNEEGKKAKSKGNHIWTIDAKKTGDQTWEFREFPRRIIVPVRHAHIGQEWSWTPRIWDPEGYKINATFTASPIPSWLAWRQNVEEPERLDLAGTPPEGTPNSSTIISVKADFEHEGERHAMEAAFQLVLDEPGGEMEISRPASSVAARSRAASSVGGTTVEQIILDSAQTTGPPSPTTPHPLPNVAVPQPSNGPSAEVLDALLAELPTVASHPEPVAPVSIGAADMATLAAPASASFLPQPILPPPLPAGSSTMAMLPPPLPEAVSEASSISDLLSPVNLLKEEMAAAGEQRPGPIESAVLHHASIPQVSGNAIVLSQAQEQVSAAVSEAQAAKISELLEPVAVGSANPSPELNATPTVASSTGGGSESIFFPPPPPLPLP